MSDDQDNLKSLLTRVGTESQVIDAVLRIDAVMLHWRRKMTKRELGRRAIEKLNLPIEQSQLDVLFAISAPTYTSTSANNEEVMVATIAERLAIDPSRASRMVAELVCAGYAQRAVSQADARRTIVELTKSGKAIVEAVLAYKGLLLADYFSGWAADDIATFVPLLERYTDWFNDVATSEARLASEIEEIARSASISEPQND